MGSDPRDETAAAATAPPAPVAQGVLDQDVISGLVELGDVEFLAELVQDFLFSTDTYLATLEGALGAGDADTVRSTAHTMKSSAASMGATRFSELCRGLERCGADGDVAGARHLFEELRPHFVEVAAALNAEVGGGGA